MSSNLKKLFEKTVEAAVKPLGSVGVTPNHITVAGLAVAVVSAWLYAGWGGDRLRLVYGAASILLSGFLDAIDGVLARSTGSATRFGGFFDSVSDRYSDALTLSGIILSGLCSVPAGLAALIGSLMVSYTRSRAEAEGVNMAGVGFFERAERMMFLALCSLAAYWWLPALQYGVIVLAALAHVTVAQRALYYKKMVEKP
ncbi:CDP-alcohol phosphatidyltransferase family protein [Candidatus Bathyarchaeota archaeon]|nr:CDP-alcohol phosphatidyltransferase family protein [Candidatus Bathyarchaeota archaeon]